MRISTKQRKILDAFGLGILQDMANVMTSLEARGVAEQDVREVVLQYVAEKKSEAEIAQKEVDKQLEKKQKDYASKAPQCPECHKPLMIRPITAPEGVKNVHGYKSQWYCINDVGNCIYERYSNKEMADELAAHNLLTQESDMVNPRASVPVKKTTAKTPAENAKEAKSKPCQGCG